MRLLFYASATTIMPSSADRPGAWGYTQPESRASHAHQTKKGLLWGGVVGLALLGSAAAFAYENQFVFDVPVAPHAPIAGGIPLPDPIDKPPRPVVPSSPVIPINKTVGFFTMEQKDTNGVYHDTISQKAFEQEFFKTKLAQDLGIRNNAQGIAQADTLFNDLHANHVSANYYLATINQYYGSYGSIESNSQGINPGDQLWPPRLPSSDMWEIQNAGNNQNYAQWPKTFQGLREGTDSFAKEVVWIAEDTNAGAKNNYRNATVDNEQYTYLGNYPQTTEYIKDIKADMAAYNAESNPNGNINIDPVS